MMITGLNYNTRSFFSDRLAKLKAQQTVTNNSKANKPNKHQPPVGKLTRSQSLAMGYAQMFLR